MKKKANFELEWPTSCPIETEESDHNRKSAFLGDIFSCSETTGVIGPYVKCAQKAKLSDKWTIGKIVSDYKSHDKSH